MKRVGYRNAKEAIAEKFHMSERLLAMLNPHVPLDHAEKKNSGVDEKVAGTSWRQLSRQGLAAWNPSRQTRVRAMKNESNENS